MARRKIIEYEITYSDHDVDHVDWRKAQELIKNPPQDVILIERVTRYGDVDLVHGEEYDEMKEYETLFKRTESEEFHHSPISAHCEDVLAHPPKCFDFRGVRAFVMCRAWDLLEKEKRTKLPVSEAWQEARKVCERE